MTSRISIVGVAIALGGLVALVGRAEYIVRTSPHWRFAIEGYDPRDLLYGHYLQVRYRFNRAGPDTCGYALHRETQPSPELLPWSTSSDGLELDPQCCLCLTRTNPEGIDPEVRQTSCDEAHRECDGSIPSGSMMPPIQYFIPEDQGPALDQALRERQAALEVVVHPDGSVGLVELYLDGQPWRDRI